VSCIFHLHLTLSLLLFTFLYTCGTLKLKGTMGKTAQTNNMNFTYDALPPSRSDPVNHEGLTPEQEWAKIAEAAERRKIQNRNAQRKYRMCLLPCIQQYMTNYVQGHNLKRRVEALERQHNLGPLFSSPSPSLPMDSSISSVTKTETQAQGNESPVQNQVTLNLSKENPTSPQKHTIDMLDPALGSLQNFGSSGTIEPEWMTHNHFMTAPISIRSTTIPSPPITNASQSPEVCTKINIEDENDQSLLSASLMTMSSLDDYIQHNNSIIEDMCSSESISSDDLELSYHRSHVQRPVSSIIQSVIIVINRLRDCQDV
jgi:hypothetical protein